MTHLGKDFFSKSLHISMREQIRMSGLWLDLDRKIFNYEIILMTEKETKINKQNEKRNITTQLDHR